MCHAIMIIILCTAKTVMGGGIRSCVWRGQNFVKISVRLALPTNEKGELSSPCSKAGALVPYHEKTSLFLANPPRSGSVFRLRLSPPVGQEEMTR